MTKLTTERLEQFIANPLGNSLYRTEQMDMARQLLAYEQAAKNPIMYKVVSLFGDISYQKQKCKEGLFSVSVTPLYAAPVLPKQPVIPEQTEREKRVLKLINDNNLSWEILFSELEEAKGRINRLYKLPDDLDFDCEFENGDYGSDEEPWLRGRVAGFNEALKVIRRSHNAEQKSTAQPVSEPYKSAANDIIAERQRQISAEGWTPEHDDVHTDFQLALAAACYAQNVADYAAEYYHPHSSIDWTDGPEPEAWPWCLDWWKPTNPRRDLIKAGALILAEIERMDRIAPAQESE